MLKRNTTTTTVHTHIIVTSNYSINKNDPLTKMITNRTNTVTNRGELGTYHLSTVDYGNSTKVLTDSFIRLYCLIYTIPNTPIFLHQLS